MRYLVTGGTGFVGANVVRHLLARGDEVVCTVRASSPQLCLEGLPVEQVSVDLRDARALEKVFKGIDGVFHVAGIFDPGPGGGARMRLVHVEVTEAICRAAQAVGVRRVVLCSSSITVGFGPRERPGTEDTPLSPSEVYGRRGPLRTYYDTKLEQEHIARRWHDAGLETVVVNPDYVVGPWDLKPTSGALIVQMAKRWTPVYPRGGKCFVDAGDCAAGHLAAMDRGRSGERYLLGFHNLTYREFMQRVAAAVDRRPPAIPLSRRIVRVASRAGRLLTAVAPHAAAGFDPWVLRAMSQPRFRSGARAREELGLDVTPIEDSIEQALSWFRQHGYC